MKKITAFAAAVVLASGFALAAFPGVGVSADSSGVELPIVPISDDPDNWNESESEAAARELSVTFDTVMVFKDGSEKKLNIDFDHKLKKGRTSYYDQYQKTLTRDEAEKMLSDIGKEYEDIDHVEYRLNVKNGKNTNYSKDYMLDVSIVYKFSAHPESEYTASKQSLVMQRIDTTKTFDEASSVAETYDLMDFFFVIDYANAKVYKPTEAHKKAMLTSFEPSFALKLKDGTEIAVNNIQYTTKEGTYENFTYNAEISAEKVKKMISDAGKDPADFYSIVGYVTPKYPTNSGISKKSAMTDLRCSFRFNCDIKPEYVGNNFSTITEYNGNMNFAKSPALTIETKPFSGYAYREKIYREDLTLDHVDKLLLRLDIDMHKAEMTGYTDPSVKLIGDINADGRVNITDLTKLGAHIKGKKLLPDPSIADINKDKKINITDFTKLAAHIKGKKLLS